MATDQEMNIYDSHLAFVYRSMEPVHRSYQFLLPPGGWPEGERVFLSIPYRSDTAGYELDKELNIPKPVFNHWVGKAQSVANLEARVAKLEGGLVSTGVLIGVITLTLAALIYWNDRDISRNYRLLSGRIDAVKDYASCLFKGVKDICGKKNKK